MTKRTLPFILLMFSTLAVCVAPNPAIDTKQHLKASPHVMITGAGRGLGLQLTVNYLQMGHYKVSATYRGASIPESLATLQQQYPERLSLQPLDLADPSSVRHFAEQYQKRNQPIDILINNAGLFQPRDPQINTFETFDDHLDDMQQSMMVNAISPLLLTSLLMPSIANSHTKTVLFLGSAGSRFSDDNPKLPRMGFTYATSKATLHMGIKKATQELTHKANPVILTGVDPGWMDTKMGGPKAPTGSTDTAAKRIITLVNTLTPKQSGLLMDTSGNVLHW